MFENVECASVQSMLGHRYLSLDRMDNKYYKNASACFVKAYRLQKEAELCGYISFFLNAGVIDEAASDGIEKKDIKILYYKGLDSNEPTAIDSLGDLYFSGVGKNHLGMNKASAFEHYERAYEKYNDVGDFPGKRKFDTGKASTAYMIGYMLSKGLGTEQNNTRAFGYFQEAFQNGEKRAIKPLAECYLHGTGVEKNIERYNELIAMSEN
jgi:TPR repeat protein